MTADISQVFENDLKFVRLSAFKGKTSKRKSKTGGKTKLPLADILSEKLFSSRAQEYGKVLLYKEVVETPNGPIQRLKVIDRDNIPEADKDIESRALFAGFGVPSVTYSARSSREAKFYKGILRKPDACKYVQDLQNRGLTLRIMYARSLGIYVADNPSERLFTRTFKCRDGDRIKVPIDFYTELERRIEVAERLLSPIYQLQLQRKEQRARTRSENNLNRNARKWRKQLARQKEREQCIK